MSSIAETMLITVEDRHGTLRGRLQQRLRRVAELRCPDHDQPVVAVTIDAHENGWFDARWTTCCESLERQAASIVGNRC